MTGAARPSPGLILAHPVAIASIIVLVLNDHVLKPIAPGMVTGKLSDIAGLIFFPILLAEVIAATGRTVGRDSSVRGLMPWTMAATIGAFALAKTTTVGSLVFAWGLGATQWLVAFGFLRGEGISPVAHAADPTDLLAVPAVVVGWWITTHPVRSRRWHFTSPGSRLSTTGKPPDRLGVFLVIVASMASLATSQAPASTVRELSETLHLTAASPAAVRHVSWVVAATQDEFVSPELITVALTEEAGRLGEASTEVSVTVIPDEDTYIAYDDGYEAVPGVSLVFPDFCRAGCASGATIIARLASDSGADATAVLRSQLSVYLDGHDMTLVEDADRRFDGTPTTVLATATETVTVTDARPELLRSATLYVDAAALDGALAYPLVGRFSARVAVTAGAFADYAHEASIGIGDDLAWFREAQPPSDRDWLGHCVPEQDCEVEIELFSRYDPTLSGSVQEPDLDAVGFVELQWFIQASLEAFDGGLLPQDALRLELEPES